MRLFIFVIVAAAIVGTITYFRSRPKIMTGAQFAKAIYDAMPRTEVAELGSFHYNNGSWWQENPTLTTPDNKPIKVLFYSPDTDSIAPPNEEQLFLVKTISKNFPSMWPSLQKDFETYFTEMDDPAAWKDSTEWELSIDGGTLLGSWSISFKVPGGDAAWYYKDFENLKGSPARATY
jgi:hypothetical protein